MTTFSGDRPAVPRSRSGGDLVTSTSGSDDGRSLPRPGESLELGAEATRYKIVRSLGRGGTAEVFLASRLGPNGFARPVALKCILAGLDVDESTRRSFVYEAQLASKLRHPNIAEAYDLAVVGDRYYLALEYVDGLTVRAALRAARGAQRRLSEGFCCHVAASVAEALHHAHALAGEDGKPLGIVHRDVTALNVMIARSGAVKLLDFGVALARMEGRERTRTGQFRGTFVYASPEQASGEELDGRSDLFSLGVLLVEMLAGIRVFEADTDLGTMRKIAECSREVVEAATAELPPELAAVCAKALARLPADRFQDGAEFSRALREHLADRRISYWPSDCAEELRSLGLASASSSDEPLANADADGGSAEALVESEPAAEVPAERSRAGPSLRPRRRRWPAATAAAAVLVMVVSVGAARGSKLFQKTSPDAASSGALSAPAAGGSTVALPAPSTPATSSVPAPPPATVSEPDVRTEAEPIVRPKRQPADARTLTNQGGKPLAALTRKERPPFRSSSAEFADRATVGSPRATLPRGTLVEAKLLGVVAGRSPGRAEAVVTEEVTAGGVLLVPKGSKVTCSARPPANGRVPLSCDTISTADRTLTFSGVAVGEGQHVGLRLLDDEIAAGTPFVVYVSAPAAVR